MGFKKTMRKFGTEAADEALCSLGLERRRTRVAGPLVGMLTVATLAAVAGAFLAPRSAREMLGDVVKRLKGSRKTFMTWARG